MVIFILCLGPRTHVGYNELSAVGLLDVSQRSKQLILHHAHKIYHSRANHYIGHNFNLVIHLHNYETRNSQYNFTLPERVGSIGKCFYYNAIKHWNSLPIHIKAIGNFAHFKRVLKDFLSLESQRIESSDMIYTFV